MCGWILLSKTFEIFLFGVGGALKLSASLTVSVEEAASFRASFCCRRVKGGRQFGGSHARTSSPNPGFART